VVKFKLPWPLYPWGKNKSAPLSKRVDGPHSQAVRFEEEINILLMSVIELRIVRTTRSIVTTLSLFCGLTVDVRIEFACPDRRLTYLLSFAVTFGC
jgi:hypothetical protein